MKTMDAATVLAEIEREMGKAWERYRGAHPDVPDDELARDVLAHASDHEWRLVDAALHRLRCSDCGAELGAGPRGCPACDVADGTRFAGREIDRPAVPLGNEHAVRVSTAVLRAPHRYPKGAVAGNRLFLPLLVRGQIPTVRDHQAIVAATRNGLPGPALASAGTFEEMAAVARRAGR